ncbi:hypothetical protein DFS34DRAFT_654578 [Phlyctochytrium arcticum]|nr:hypothetical protein DFS34DRAFT_654578 [Phlyctochytrium arcticum]
MSGAPAGTPSKINADPEEYVDCLACKVTGTATALGFSVYTLYERGRITVPAVGLTRPKEGGFGMEIITQEMVKRARFHRGFLGVLSGAFAAAGIYRAIM